jgi:hypothetical protein
VSFSISFTYYYYFAVYTGIRTVFIVKKNFANTGGHTLSALNKMSILENKSEVHYIGTKVSYNFRDTNSKHSATENLRRDSAKEGPQPGLEFDEVKQIYIYRAVRRPAECEETDNDFYLILQVRI